MSFILVQAEAVSEECRVRSQQQLEVKHMGAQAESTHGFTILCAGNSTKCLRDISSLLRHHQSFCSLHM